MMGDLDNGVPEVVAEVKAEIQKLGAGAKANKENFEALNKGFEEIKHLVSETKSSNDILLKETITKWTDDVTTRQVELSTKLESKIAEEKKALDTRMDGIEVAMKRPGGIVSPEQARQDEMFAKKLAVDCQAVGCKSVSGVKWDQVDGLNKNVEDYRNYVKAYKAFLRRHNQRHVPPEELKALSVGIDPDGGYTVTPAISNRIVKRMYEMDPLRALANVENISTDALEIMVDYGQAGAGWESETEAGGDTDTAGFNKKRIPVHVLYAKPKATQTLLEDSAINIENWIADKQADRFNRVESAAFVSGNGVGKPRGFLTYDNYDTAGEDQWGRIERQNMGAANSLTGDGFVDVKFRLIEQFLQRGTWLMNRLTVAAAMKLKDGQGNWIWSPGLTEDNHSMILGLPVRMSTTMPQVTAGAFSVAIADWAEAYTIVDRLGITVQRDPYTQTPYIMFYTRKRVGGDVSNYQSIKLGVIAA